MTHLVNNAEDFADQALDGLVAARGTAEFAAKRGRSRTHADKSIGTPDPGAVSFAKIVAVLRAHVSDV